jgi:uncharacterized protein YecE (DUF72 family)
MDGECINMPNLFIGTSGYSYKNWRGQFYPPGVPQKAWLTFYAQHYNAVEINATFYRPFPEHVFAHWYEITPAEFRFVLKAPKVITHEKALDDLDAELQQFVSSIGGLKEKLTAVLWQFPASVQAAPLQERFQKFLGMLPQGIKHVFEFRHASWFTEETYALLNQFHAGFVMNDSPHFQSREVITGQLVYVRFHGSDKLYNSLYSSDQLRAWADKIAPYLDRCDIYLFFNNTYAGQALDNAKEMLQLLTK